jgi:excisionase family DNA binding protein
MSADIQAAESLPTLTIREAAHEYKVSEKTIRRYIAQGKIPKQQAGFGTVIRIPRQAWNRFIAGRRG